MSGESQLNPLYVTCMFITYIGEPSSFCCWPSKVVVCCYMKIITSSTLSVFKVYLKVSIVLAYVCNMVPLMTFGFYR